MSTLSAHHTDVLIVGAGGSGLSASIFLADLLPHIKISILCKTYAMGSHTTSAKGGINAALGNIKNDEITWHIHDTLSASKYLSDVYPTTKMCQEAPNIINFLTRIGVHFDKTSNGVIDQRPYGGQTTHYGKGELANRACFVKDYTGHAIMSALVNQVNRNPNIHLYNYIQALSIVTVDKIHYVTVYNISTGKIEIHSARYIIFATGGFSQVYKTNSSSNLYTGCGHRILFEYGAALKDIELVQFHPTGIDGSGILISEACRSQGGHLINSNGERFMERYHPLRELASRDIIVNAMHKEIKNGNIYLDLRHLPPELIKAKLISSYNVVKYFAKIDLLHAPVSVVPTAHYNMGGISVDEHYHICNGIYAIGELACASVHGSNRLGCNSLLELFTSAKFATQHIAQNFHRENPIDLPSNVNVLQSKNSDISLREIFVIKEEVQDIMEKNASVLKNHSYMQDALLRINVIYDQIKNLNNFTSKSFDSSFVNLFELQSLVLMSKCVLTAALFREHSIGAHQREDFPDLPKTPQHTLLDQTFTVKYCNVR